MKVAKASINDLDTTKEFLSRSEDVLEGQNYSWKSPWDEWEEWDDDDPDKIWILKEQKRLMKEQGLTQSQTNEFDARILMYEFLRMKFKKCSTGFNRVTMAAEILIPECCDPTERHLAWHPCYEMQHVTPEQ